MQTHGKSPNSSTYQIIKILGPDFKVTKKNNQISLPSNETCRNISLIHNKSNFILVDKIYIIIRFFNAILT